jgi:hypothetical protein
VFQDITSVSKNFSMSFMQQVSSVLGYVLNLIGAKQEHARFWFDLDECIRAVFINAEAKEVPVIREKFITTLKTGKKLFPEAEKRRPQNLHNVLEFLEMDMEIWVSAYLISGAKEEHKHQIFKGGVAFTNGVDPEGQLVERERIVSGLRFLLHGGEHNGVNIPKDFREFTHPNNPHVPHPLLLTLTTYGRKEETSEKAVPRKFLYSSDKRQVIESTSPTLASELTSTVQVTAGEPCFHSKQVVVRGKVFSTEEAVVFKDADR